MLLPEDRQKLLQLKQSLDPSVDAVSMEYHCDFDDHSNVTLNVRRTRIVKRIKNFQWHGVVHEDLSVYGNMLDSDIAVTHKQVHMVTDRNLKIYENRLREGKAFTPQDIFHYAYELHHQYMYEKATVFYLKFLEFEYDTPRPEFCCRLGYHFLQKNALKEAVFWYQLAINSPLPENNWVIVNEPSRTWLPHMQLGLCYYRLGRYDLSYQHNKNRTILQAGG